MCRCCGIIASKVLNDYFEENKVKINDIFHDLN